MSGRKQDKDRSIIIRKEEVVEGGHHGGAWKVAYADFVTAMMAFFLLMWLLNATTQEQKRGLADYFSPNSHLSRTTSGIGAPFAGKTPNVDGALLSEAGAVQLTRSQPYPEVDADEDTGDSPAQVAPSKVAGTTPTPTLSQSDQFRPEPPRPEKAEANHKPSEQDIQKELERREKVAFEQAAKQIKDAVASDPALAELAKQLTIDITPEGMRIQLLDADRTPMFSTGSSALNDRARALLAKVAPVLLKMPQAIAIAGHTDSAPYKGGERSNWDLSADRANVTRKLLVAAGLPGARRRSVTGPAARAPLVTNDPLAAANRRIAIVLLRDRPAPAR